MTIKPVVNQKTSGKKDAAGKDSGGGGGGGSGGGIGNIQDVTVGVGGAGGGGGGCSGSGGGVVGGIDNLQRPTHRLVGQKGLTSIESINPQLASGSGGISGGGGGGGGSGASGLLAVGSGVGGNVGQIGNIGGVSLHGRRRRSPHKRIHKRGGAGGGSVGSDGLRCDKLGKSPPYQGIDKTITPCSSPQFGGSKSPTAVASNSVMSSAAVGLMNNNIAPLDDSYSGYNSGDEHIGQKDTALTPDEWDSRDKNFLKIMSDRGFIVNEIAEDGACLFRSISLQIYGDQDMHEDIRQQTMDYIFKNREYFAQFVTEDITNYVSRKRNLHVHGNHIEIQAISEIYNRPVELYCYQAEPINIFNSDQIKQGYEPLRLSYQRGSHYNAILNPYKASVGVGLGLPGYRPDEPDRKQLHDAVRQSEDLEIEQTMFEDKLKTTDWEATNEAIEEQIARESYMQWCRENLHKEPSRATTATSAAAVMGSSSTVTSSECSHKGQSSKSPAFSGEDSEDFTPYASDDERPAATAAAPSSSSSSPSPLLSGKNAADSHIYYVQQRQRRRKRRRGGAAAAAASAVVAAIAATAGPSTTAPPTVHESSPPKQQRTDDIEAPGTSKQDDDNKLTAAAGSSFYHALLESSYSDDFFDVGQLSEEKMLQKALQMSRMDYVQKQQHPSWPPNDSDPSSP